jgi:hypothetical protein
MTSRSNTVVRQKYKPSLPEPDDHYDYADEHHHQPEHGDFSEFEGVYL